MLKKTLVYTAAAATLFGIGYTTTRAITSRKS